jgi:uncharacterized membrane protein YqjE
MSEEEISPAGAPATGLFRSLSKLLATLFAVAQTRLELLTTEVQEEIQRATALLIWGAVALLSAGIGIFFIGITIILAFWDTHRLPAALAVTGVVVGICVVSLVILSRKVRGRVRLLHATRTELAKDREQLAARL